MGNTSLESTRASPFRPFQPPAGLMEPTNAGLDADAALGAIEQSL
jgi:hypothetical protein